MNKKSLLSIGPERLLVACFLLLLLLRSPAVHAAAFSPDQGVRSDLQQMIPLHDGVRLAATVWRPLDQVKPLPVVMMLTPYVSDETHDRAVKFVQGGYVYVVVDVRGRGDSEGVFHPLEDAGPDGAEVVEWLAKQPWCDGRVAMIGGSYRGMVQWDILARHPQHLAAIVPTAAVYPGYDFPNWKGIMPSYDVQWLAFVSGRTPHTQLFGDSDYWNTQFGRMYKGAAAFASLAPLAGSNETVFGEWVQHHGYDAYWAAHNPDPKDYAGKPIPILAITGYFDGDQPGELRHYREFSANASSPALAQLYLLTGPWDHAGTRYPQKELGGLTFPDNSVLDMDKLQIDWLDWVLKHGKRPDIISDRVNYYAVDEGAGHWMHAASLSAMSNHSLRFYLSSPAVAADDVFHSGDLVTSMPAAQQPDSLRVDPEEKDGLLVDGSTLGFLVDPSRAYQKRLLIYQSAPLSDPLTVAGFMKLTANLSLDAPDADLAVEVDAILPDGRTLVIGNDMLRARYRHGTDRELPVTPGAIEPYVFDGFYLTDQRLPAGSRLRLILTSVDTPHLERNDDTGGPLGVEGMQKGRVATFTLHMEPEHPSYLELPLAAD